MKRTKAYSANVNAPNGEGARAVYSDENRGKDLVFEGEFNEGMEANLYTSHVMGAPGKHAVCIDIDMPAELLPSRTPGHFHLYIDHIMEWEPYVKLLTALAEAGIIEQGYAEASIAKGCTALRLPPNEVEFERIRKAYMNGTGEDYEAVEEALDRTYDLHTF